MIRFVFLVLTLLCTETAFAGYSALDEFVVLLSEGEGVAVHRRNSEQALVSWPALPSRRVGKKTVVIVQQLSDFIAREPGVYVHLTLSADTAEDKAEALLKSLDYKAEKLRQSLLKKADGAVTIMASGVVNQHSGNRIYALIQPHYDPAQPLRVALPLPKTDE